MHGKGPRTVLGTHTAFLLPSPGKDWEEWLPARSAVLTVLRGLGKTLKNTLPTRTL